MDVITAVILGIVQGLTEFIPISSSGHLVVVREILGVHRENGLAIDAVFQLATAVALAVYFRRELGRLLKVLYGLTAGKVVDTADKLLLSALLLGTIPAVVIGILVEDYLDTAFRSISVVVAGLLIGSLIMIVAERLFTGLKELSVKSGLKIGLFQALALIPGMSRSGMTISGGLFLGLTRAAAARFAFILGIPIIAGSGVKKLLDLGLDGTLADMFVPIIAGSVAAFISGILAIHYLLLFLRRHTLHVFIVYRVILAFVLLGFVLI
jgi:undecaprenyl-diphosphatase